MVGATNISYTVTLNNNTAYKSYRFRSTVGVANPGLARIQFYGVSLDIPTPINSLDIANKDYVDSKIGRPSTSYQSITTSSGSTTLTASNDIVAYLFGSQSHTVVFPAASSLSIGARIVVMNRSSVACTINDTTQYYQWW